MPRVCRRGERVARPFDTSLEPTSGSNLAVHQLDPRHWSAVALSRPQLQDPRIPALTLLEPRRDLVEQACDHVAVGDVLQHLPPSGEIATFGLCDELLRVGPEHLRLRLCGVDRFVDEQLGRETGQQQPLMPRIRPQSAAPLRLGHRPYSSRRLRPSSSSFAFTSSIDFWPKLRISISSDSERCTRSPTALIPSRFKQLYERTERFNSSIVIA